MDLLSRHLIIISLLCIVATANGQPNLLARTYSKEEGFTTAAVNAITQDDQGFLWLGTSTGLYRFDGYNFLPFRHIENDSLSLSDNFIRCLYADGAGSLWIGTLRGGLCRMDLRQFAVHRIHNTTDSIGKVTQINAIEGDRDGNLWVASTRGLHRFTSEKWQHPKLTGLPPRYRPFALHATRDGRLWVGFTSQTLASYNVQTGEFQYYDLPGTKDKPPGLVRSLVEDSTGHLWLSANQDGLIRFNPEGNQVDYVSGPTGEAIWSVMQLRGGRLLASGNNALYSVDKNALALLKIDDPRTGILTDGPRCAFESNEGMIWIGTVRKGVITAYQLPGLTMTPIPFKATLSNIKKIGSTHYYFFSGKGIRLRNPATGLDSLRQVAGMPPSEYYIYDAVIHPVGTLWLATTGGVYRLNPAGQWKRYEQSGSPVHSLQPITILHFDEKTHQLWAGGNGLGCYQYDSRSDSFNYVEGSGGQIEDITTTSKGLWTAKPDNGLRFIPFGTGEIMNFIYQEDDSTSISNSYVSKVLVDRTGILWAGTLNGLNRFNTSTANFKRIKISDQSNSIYQIDYASDSSFLIKTKEGVFRFNPLNEAVTPKRIETPIDLANPYGVLHYPWFTYENDGFLVECNLDSITPKASSPKVAITALTLDPNNNHPLRPEEVKQNPTYRNHIELDYDQNLINLSFAALDYSTPGKNQYAYKLGGFDARWTFCGERNFVTYTNLDPGNYTFEVRGANGFGIWSEQTATLSIVILPPPWKTWWAYTGYGLIFMAVLYMARKTTVNRERLKAQIVFEQREKQSLRELDHMKSKFFSNITHEFRTPLTLIQGPAHELYNRSPDPESRQLASLIQDNSKRLLKLINQLLDLAKLDAREMKLRPTAVNLSDHIPAIHAQFASIATSRNISYDLDLADELPVVLVDEPKLEVILTNLLSNAFKFTPEGGSVAFEAGYRDGSLLLRIKDTGRGIPPDQLPKIFDRFYQVSPSDTSHAEGTGIGLALVKEYIELMHGVIQVNSQVGQGTAFEIELPLPVADSELGTPDMIRATLTPDQSQSTLPVNHDNSEAPLILLVEDNADIRAFVKTCLGKDYRFADASHGQAGLEAARSQVPDLIISDWMMPEMDGMEFCRRIKKDSRTDHIPLILLTAKATHENRLEGLRTGADDYLVKPFDREELLLKIQNLLTSRERLQAHLRRSQLTTASPLEADSMEEKFVARARAYVEKNLQMEALSVEELAGEMALSREQFYRKMVALTGLSPSAFIRKLRLQHAAQLLASGSAMVSEAAFQTGFASLSHFSKAFKEEFGVTPSEFRQSNPGKAS